MSGLRPILGFRIVPKSILFHCISQFFKTEAVSIPIYVDKKLVCLADESGDIFSKGFANLALGLSYRLKGCLKEAKEHFLKSGDLLQRINQLTWESNANLFECHLFGYGRV
jgi:hypothetical protein